MKDEWLVIGLGYVGLTYAVHLANNTSVSVSGTDISPLKIYNLNQGVSHIFEKNFTEEFQKAIKANNLNFVLPNQISKHYSALIVCIETPLPTEDYERELEQFVDSLIPYLKHLAKNGALMLRSTISIGTTSKIQEELIRRGREDVITIFLPERTAAGAAVEELATLPQLYGIPRECDRVRAREILVPIDTDLIELSSSEAAEATKLIGNAWRDSTFALSNSIAALAREFNLNAGEIISAANNGYSRNNIPRPGFVGGPCLSKDTYILSLNPRTKNSTDLFVESRKFNEGTTRQIVNEIFDILTKSNFSKIYIVGVTFKGFPETNDIRESLGCLLVEEILAEYPNYELYVLDPLEHQLSVMSIKASFVSVDELQDNSLIIITNNYSFVKTNKFINAIQSLGKNVFIYDAAGAAESLAHLPNYWKFGDYSVH